MYTLSVSALNEQIKGLLEESFSRVVVEGELSRITFHNSGHIYFTLKDEASSLSCVMFRANASKLKFQLKEGLKVTLDGALTLYKPRGTYQINCFSIEPFGKGALALAYEQLKEKLEKKGYFSPSLKKQLPKFPKKIALITSATGAALQDMLRVATQRYKVLEIDIYDVLVQGEGASYAIQNAIQRADDVGYDIVVIGRGGGSIEDLWAFNEERVADAIYNAKTPIVSAVGHEIDFVLSDFCADLRAPTPSAAMQMILPDSNEILLYIDTLEEQYKQQLHYKIQEKASQLKHIKELLMQNSFDKKIQQRFEQIKYLKEYFTQQITFRFKQYKQELQEVQNILESNHSKIKQRKGYAQISLNNKVIDLSELKIDDEFALMNEQILVSAKVVKKQKI